MDIKTAIGVVARLVGKGGVAILSDQQVEGTNGSSGVVVPCEELSAWPKTVGVDAAILRKMVSSMTDPVLTLSRATLKVTDGPNSFSLKCVPPSALPSTPIQAGAEPDWDVVPTIPADTCAALSSITSVADSDNDSAFALHGIRLTADWAATCSQALMAVAWCEGLVTESVTVPANVLAGLSGDLKFTVEDGRVWLREDGTGQRRWSLLIALPFPDTAINDTLAKARDQLQRVEMAVPATGLVDSLKMAQVVAEGGESIHRMTVEDGKLCFRSKAEKTGFDGGLAVKVEANGRDSDDPVGVSAEKLHQVAEIVAAACDGTEDAYMSIGSGRDPILVWGGASVTIETLAMPCHLS